MYFLFFAFPLYIIALHLLVTKVAYILPANIEIAVKNSRPNTVLNFPYQHN